MVLEEHIIFVSSATNTAEDVAAHKMISVRSEAVDDLDTESASVGSAQCFTTHIMVVPDVELRDLAVGGGERLGVVPPYVVFQIVVVAFCAKLLRKGVTLSLLGATDVRPRPQWAVNSNTIVIDLITTPHHAMVWCGLMLPQHIVPQACTTPSVLVSPHTEAVARVEHDAHGLGRSWDEETVGPGLVFAGEAQLGYKVFILDFGRFNGGLDLEGPEGVSGVGVQALGINTRPPRFVSHFAIRLANSRRKFMNGTNTSDY